MRFLLIHTGGAEGTVALGEVSPTGARVVAETVLPGRTSSERLVPEIRLLLEGQDWRLAELSAIAVVHGPGSFTGVRVGLSAAKGLSEAGGVPLIAVSRLALLAAAGQEVVKYPVLDAGRGEFYLGVYEGEVCVGESLLPAAEVVSAVGRGRVIACEAKVAEGLQGIDVEIVSEPVAGDLLPIAIGRLQRDEVDDAAVVDANYLRRTDAEIFSSPPRRAGA